MGNYLDIWYCKKNCLLKNPINGSNCFYSIQNTTSMPFYGVFTAHESEQSSHTQLGKIVMSW